MTKKELLKELSAITIIISVLLIVIFLTSFIDNECFLYFLIFYVPVGILFHTISSFTSNKILEKVTEIFFLPIAILLAIGLFILPFLTLLLHIIFYFCFAYLLPEITYKTLNYFHLIDSVEQSAILYLKITITVTISVLFNPLLRDVIYRFSPMTRKSSEKLKRYNLSKLTDYFLSADNVRFLVYTFYVILLLIINVYNFQEIPLKSSFEMDKAILQSFITFIAIDRALALMKQLEFKPSELLNRIKETIKTLFNN